jgi:hypothetical protein
VWRQTRVLVAQSMHKLCPSKYWHVQCAGEYKWRLNIAYVSQKCWFWPHNAQQKCTLHGFTATPGQCKAQSRHGCQQPSEEMHLSINRYLLTYKGACVNVGQLTVQRNIQSCAPSNVKHKFGKTRVQDKVFCTSIEGLPCHFNCCLTKCLTNDICPIGRKPKNKKK